jgi:hypothetical protein
MSEIYKKEFGLYIDIKVDYAQFYRDYTENIKKGLDSGEIKEEDRQFWQDQYDKLSKMDLSMLPDRGIIPPKNEG